MNLTVYVGDDCEHGSFVHEQSAGRRASCGCHAKLRPPRVAVKGDLCIHFILSRGTGRLSSDTVLDQASVEATAEF